MRAHPASTHTSDAVRVLQGERRYACCYCSWSGVDNWCLKRHLNTHLKPFACALCEYKAARAERLATHVHKVHNKKACGKCPFLADEPLQLAQHLRDAQSVSARLPPHRSRSACRGTNRSVSFSVAATSRAAT